MSAASKVTGVTILNEVRIPITADVDIVTARQQGRVQAQRGGFDGTELTVISTAISEIARNILDYAARGEIVIRIVNDGVKVGVVVIASDEGPGIANLSLALQDGYSTGRGLGLGLPGARRLMDEFEIVSSPGQGTLITMKKWRRKT
jgi:serine/threonine-protein kinase RsbT